MMKLPRGKYYVSMNLFHKLRDLNLSQLNSSVTVDYIDNCNNLCNGKEWACYRLSDTVRFKNHNINNKQIHVKWPNSIIDLFMNATNIKYDARKFGLKRICFIIDNYFPIQILEPYIAIHLRVGDRLGIWSNPLSFYDDLDISKFSCKNVILFSGHHRGNHAESLIYIKKVYKILENKGLNVVLRCGNNPDDDFVLMVKSTHFIKSGGGYSQTILDVREYLQKKNTQ